MTFLPDVNFWLALAFESHAHHRRARTWFEGLADDRCLFCRLTQLGFLRLATNPQAFGDEAVSLAGAWTLYDALLGDSLVEFMDEPAGMAALWRSHTERRDFSPKIWNDAYLAAFASTSTCELVTFDRGFSQYSGLSLKVLS